MDAEIKIMARTWLLSQDNELHHISGVVFGMEIQQLLPEDRATEDKELTGKHQTQLRTLGPEACTEIQQTVGWQIHIQDESIFQLSPIGFTLSQYACPA